MDLHEYESSALYGELMRRGESPRYEWALHVVALEEMENANEIAGEL